MSSYVLCNDSTPFDSSTTRSALYRETKLNQVLFHMVISTMWNPYCSSFSDDKYYIESMLLYISHILMAAPQMSLSFSPPNDYESVSDLESLVFVL